MLAAVADALQDPACQLSVQQRSVVAKVVHQAAKKAQLPTFGLPGKVIA